MIDVPRELADLRLVAERAARAEDDDALLPLADDLRGDTEWWHVLWAPALAVAASRTGRPDALDFLREAVEGGFNQPDVFEGQLEACFADAPDWPELSAAMEATPPAPWELLDWPEISPHQPLVLETIASERSAALVERLPEPRPSAWETARALLTWVHQQWQHANDHVTEPDALDVLDRVAAGERFACVEYSIVLTQALNAVGIPARRLQLFQAARHQGFGRGHVVSEAWIDDLARWVLLDGQNGAWWTSGDGPLGVLELQARHAEGAAPAELVSEVESYDDSATAAWWTYFAGAMTTGYAWGAPFGGIFQDSYVVKAATVLRDGAQAYPDLDQVGVGLSGTRASPHVVLHTNHPHAVGFESAGRTIDLDDPRLPVDLTVPGEHTIPVRVRTPYGTGREHQIRHVIRD